MSLKIIAITTAALSLIASDVFAQANHNTSRSNNRPGGVAAPGDTATDTSVNSGKIAEEIDHTGHVTLIKSAEGGDSNNGDVSSKSSTNGGRHGGDFDFAEVGADGSPVRADTGTDVTTLKSNTTGTGNTANGYQALSPQGAPADTQGDVTGNVIIQKDGVNTEADADVLNVNRNPQTGKEIQMPSEGRPGEAGPRPLIESTTGRQETDNQEPDNQKDSCDDCGDWIIEYDSIDEIDT